MISIFLKHKQQVAYLNRMAQAVQASQAELVVPVEVNCSICADKYTPIVRKRIPCKYCTKDTCSKCIEQYLLTRSDEPHCIHCKVHYNDKDLHTICTKTYLKDRFFKHRQEVLISRERANLPGLQDAANRMKRVRDRELIKVRITKELNELIEIRNALRHEQIRLEVLPQRTEKETEQMTGMMMELDEYGKTIAIKKQELFESRIIVYHEDQEMKSADDEKADDRRKFIRRCVRSNCNGFLSTAWKCGLCDWYSCSKCFTERGPEHDTPHECKKDDLDTAELIRKDSKPCPNCGEFINKSSGCFAPNTPILTWNGGIKMSQDIRVGDELVGDDGTKRTVLSLVSGEDMMYEVTQNNGLTYVVNSKHTFVLQYTGEQTISWHSTENKWAIHWFDRKELQSRSKYLRATDETKEQVLQQMTEFKESLNLSDAIEIVVEDYMKLKDSVKKSLVGFKCKGINWPKQDVPLDPYLMGVYLGDGINCGTAFAINASEDPEILEYILNWAEEHNCEVVHDDIYRFRVRRRENKINTQKAIGHGATSATCKGCAKKSSGFCDRPDVPYTNKVELARKNPLCDILTQYGMVGGLKRIPTEYLVNDRETRLQVLAGIIDTDGHLNKMNEGKRIQIISSKKEFANQIVYLARSLGFPTTIRSISKKGVSFSKGGEKKDYDDHYGINISGNISEIPTRILRKKCVDAQSNKCMLRTSISVKPIGQGEYYGWSVDANKRFLLADTTVLRNCNQMYCVSCQTPFDWITLKIVTSGAIHNPHYYEMMKRKGALPRNPGDVPCGGFPTRWQLVAHPHGVLTYVSDHFYEFHRLCEEAQEMSRRSYRAHIDNTTTHDINIKYLLGDFDDVKWGRLLATNEKKRKRDAEVQEVFAAFLMVAVNIINTVQNYYDEKHGYFNALPPMIAEQILMDLDVEITELLSIMNSAFRDISIAYSYSVPTIETQMVNPELNLLIYRLVVKSFTKRATKKADSDEDD